MHFVLLSILRLLVSIMIALTVESIDEVDTIAMMSYSNPCIGQYRINFAEHGIYVVLDTQTDVRI